MSPFATSSPLTAPARRAEPLNTLSAVKVIITLSLAFSSFLISPYLLLFILAAINIFTTLPSVVIYLIAVSLSLYWSKREQNIFWDGGKDDISNYLRVWEEVGNGTYSSFAYYEPLYFAGFWIVGNLVRSEYFFIYTYYFAVAYSLARISIRLNSRYAAVALFLLVFSFGSFGEQMLLNWWRQMVSVICLLVAYLRLRSGRSPLLWLCASVGIHFSSIIIATLIFAVYFTRVRLKYPLIVVIGLATLAGLTLSAFFQNFGNFIFAEIFSRSWLDTADTLSFRWPVSIAYTFLALLYFVYHPIAGKDITSNLLVCFGIFFVTIYLMPQVSNLTRSFEAFHGIMAMATVYIFNAFEYKITKIIFISLIFIYKILVLYFSPVFTGMFPNFGLFDTWFTY